MIELLVLPRHWIQMSRDSDELHASPDLKAVVLRSVVEDMVSIPFDAKILFSSLRMALE